MAAITICSDFGAPKNKSYSVSTVSPSISHEVMGLDAMILVFEPFSITVTQAYAPTTILLKRNSTYFSPSAASIPQNRWEECSAKHTNTNDTPQVQRFDF